MLKYSDINLNVFILCTSLIKQQRMAVTLSQIKENLCFILNWHFRDYDKYYCNTLFIYAPIERLAYYFNYGCISFCDEFTIKPLDRV